VRVAGDSGCWHRHLPAHGESQGRAGMSPSPVSVTCDPRGGAGRWFWGARALAQHRAAAERCSAPRSCPSLRLHELAADPRGENGSHSPRLAPLQIHLVRIPQAGVCGHSPWVPPSPKEELWGGVLGAPVLWARGGCAAAGSLLRNRNQALVSSGVDERWLPGLQPLT